ncbi:hypothetical protein CKO31_00015 [Thiohalocapsa halophila]|uniref:DUF29 domain-containing protein n=1 Tax=Thiohalocapsa halophila TaxID=69359 RepID=A0ABS1CBC3_9GAMM|nr:DUF29 domain-containing protein [Thiohalocapsa halophila]MBK1629142.1 hypothetical protein [Thiohalocapsa halophila]
MTSNQPLYDQDFYAWTEQQVRLLRAGRLQDADLVHIAEEIETLGASERRELESRLKVLLMHLLKWQHQPDERSSGWMGTIDEQRDQLDTLLRQSPSLRRLVPETLAYAYPKAKRAAAHETGLPRACFPEHCPFSPEQALDPEFWPND